MQSALAHVTSVTYIAIAAFGAVAPAPCIAQTHVLRLDELRRELAAGDRITVVPADGPAVTGRLVRFGHLDLDVRPAGKRTPLERRSREITIPLDAIRSLERPRDPTRDGAAIGMAIGAGVGGALFVHAMAIDRNEMDEWAAAYIGVAAACIGIGALIGWTVDAANSKPYVRFDAPPAGRTAVSVRPGYSHHGGLSLAVSFSR